MLLRIASGLCLLLYVCSTTAAHGTEIDIALNTSTRQLEYNSNYTQPFMYKNKLSPVFAKAIAGCFLFIIIIAVSCNSLLIATIVAVPKLHSYMHVFIVNMAFSDLITALGTIPFDVELLLRGYFAHGILLCGVMHITFLISLPSSVLSLSLLTAERFISVVFPFRVRDIITKKTVSLAVIATWTYVIIIGFFPLMYNKRALFVRYRYCFLFFPWGYQLYQVIMNFLLPSVIIFGINVVLFRISHKHASKNTSLLSYGEENEGKKNTLRHRLFSRKQKSCMAATSLARNMKAIKRITLLVGVFMICWLFYIIIVALNYACKCHPRELTWIANVINYSSTAINPVLYGLMNKMIRKEIFKNLHRLCKSCIPCLDENNLNRNFKTKSTFEMRTMRSFLKSTKKSGVPI